MTFFCLQKSYMTIYPPTKFCWLMQKKQEIVHYRRLDGLKYKNSFLFRTNNNEPNKDDII